VEKAATSPAYPPLTTSCLGVQSGGFPHCSQPVVKAMGKERLFVQAQTHLFSQAGRYGFLVMFPIWLGIFLVIFFHGCHVNTPCTELCFKAVGFFWFL